MKTKKSLTGGLLIGLLVFGLAPVVSAATPVDGIVDYITVRATIDGKNTWYLGSDLLVVGGQEVFDLNKKTYEYSTPATEIYIFPTLTTDAMFSGIVEGPSYDITVNNAKSEKPYTYPLKKGANTFTIKILENKTRTLETYTIKINSGATAAPSTVKAITSKSPLVNIMDYITVRATIDGKNTWYLGSDLLVVGGQEVFNLDKPTYEYTTAANEIYIFPTLTTDAMFSGIVEGPSYDITVNNVKSAKPYTYPLKKGANTFVVKVTENKNKVLGTYTIKINSSSTVAAAAPPAAVPAASGQLVITGLSNYNGQYVFAMTQGGFADGNRSSQLVGAAEQWTTPSQAKAVKVVNGQAAFNVYKTTQGKTVQYEGDVEKVVLRVYTKDVERFDTYSSPAHIGTVSVKFTGGKTPAIALGPK